MNIRNSVAALVAAGACSFGIGVSPAFAAGQPVPPGCSFDQATGVLTCVTTTTSTAVTGPWGTNALLPASTVIGGFTGTEICDVGLGLSLNWTTIQLFNYSFDVTTTTTTTTERHGRHGKVFSTSTSSSTTLTGVQAGSPRNLECGR